MTRNICDHNICKNILFANLLKITLSKILWHMVSLWSLLITRLRFYGAMKQYHYLTHTTTYKSCVLNAIPPTNALTSTCTLVVLLTCWKTCCDPHSQTALKCQLQLKGSSHVGCASCHYKENNTTQSQHISLLCTVFWPDMCKHFANILSFTQWDWGNAAKAVSASS